eukprot:TRINITY_DN3129_c0_g2_i1.p1 TRINITY_DN3129_c0_g2~~TRINITY_DN3129_c0_g2_i1.p1  ORF type:complete len:762 (+),score=135.77 TRINITY_DN3129_c0_g2_i1:98-2383(+)
MCIRDRYQRRVREARTRMFWQPRAAAMRSPLATLLLVALLSSCTSQELPSFEAVKLSQLNIDKQHVVTAGYGHSADFAHQFHVAFSATVSGACVFGGQPFYCAVSQFSQDAQVPLTPSTRVPVCDGCQDNMTLPFDHCKLTPDVVDVGSLVDFPRRHCGQNPVTIYECFDDVKYLEPSRVFLFRGTQDQTSLPGAIENTVAFLGQMIRDPAETIKLVRDQPFGALLPLTSTPFTGSSEPAGYDGPGECLRHVFSAPSLAPGTQVASNWFVFDQTEFFTQPIGFQDQGWVYIPQQCRPGNGTPCKLIVRPDKCSPPTVFAPDVADFAGYAEENSFVVLHPCVGGAVNSTAFPHAPDIEAGKLDAYGQLDANYVQQSAPHMRTVGNMLKRVLGAVEAPPVQNRPQPDSTPAVSVHVNTPPAGPTAVNMPTLNIDRSSVMTAGCSNTADFSHQFHVAFASLVTGSCIFSGMPFHCAVTRFPQDYMVAKSPSTAAGIHCPNCTQDGTLVYDHCKNHPKWVDVNMLGEYAETAADVDDPRTHLADARVFAFGPTFDRCYQPPAMENIRDFHLKYAKDQEQILLVEDQPFPHTLPSNDTPYANNNSNTTGAGYDGPGKCLQHVFGLGERLYPAANASVSNWLRIDASEFVTDLGVGMFPSAWLYVPDQCAQGLCKLLILPGGCDAMHEDPPSGGQDLDWMRYGQGNNFVILKPCQGAPIDVKRFPNNHENRRGMVDIYGQLSADYATQKGDQMEPIGNMLKRLLGLL